MIFKKILYKLLYGGAFRLSKIERCLFKALGEHLDEEIRTSFEMQVDSVFFIQREHENRITRYSLDEDKCSIIPCTEDECRLATIKYVINKKQYIVYIEAYKGYLVTMETQNGMSNDEFHLLPEEVVITTEVFKVEKSVPELIDSEEHSDVI